MEHSGGMKWILMKGLVLKHRIMNTLSFHGDYLKINLEK